MPEPTDTPLAHPHPPDTVFAALSTLLTPEELLDLVSMIGDNQRAVEDGINTAKRDVIVHLTTLTDGLASDKYFVADNTSLVRMQLSLSTAGSSTSEFTVSLTGTDIYTFTLAANDSVEVTQIMRRMSPAVPDYLVITCDTAGTGAAGAVATFTFAPGLA